MEKIYNLLNSFADCNIVDKCEHGTINLIIKKYLGKLKVIIEYQGHNGNSVKNNVEPILEKLTNIPQLIKKLVHQGIKRRVNNHRDKFDFFGDAFVFSCELEDENWRQK